MKTLSRNRNKVVRTLTNTLIQLTHAYIVCDTVGNKLYCVTEAEANFWLAKVGRNAVIGVGILGGRSVIASRVDTRPIGLWEQRNFKIADRKDINRYTVDLSVWYNKMSKLGGYKTVR